MRIHDGPSAAANAGRLEARAFTVGRDVYFASREYDPDSTAGRRLLAHELTHVLQPSEPARIRRQPASPGPLRYSASVVPRLTLPPADFDDARDELKRVIASGNLTEGVVLGQHDDAMLGALLHAIATVGTLETRTMEGGREVVRRKEWGYEIDLLIPLRPSKKLGSSPVAQVSVRVDSNGKAKAELLSLGAVNVPATAASGADAEAQLKQTYGIADVGKVAANDQDSGWKLSELNIVLGGFAKIPARDRHVLKGMVLERVAVAELPGGRAAQHSTTGAQEKIEFADKAFVTDTASLIGDKNDISPFAYMTILHEVGHAVEIEERHEATRERLRKGEALEAAKDLRNTAEVEVDEERKQKKPKKGAKSPPTEKEAKLQELEAKVGVAGQEYAGAIQAEDKATAHDALLKEADASRTVAADALAAAQQASSGATGPAAALGTLVAAADSALGFYRDAAKFRATTAASKAHVADTRTKAEAAVAAAETQARSLDAQNPARATFGPVIAAQKAWLAALVRVTDNATTSERLRAFESFVRSNNIAPPTEYAGTGIYDFYAESYALYVLDPTFLKNNRPKLFDWFEVNR